MKILISYFSGTGNTELIGRYMTEEFNRYSDVECRLIPVEDILRDKSILNEEDTIIGIGYPVYDYQPPRSVMELLNLVIKKKVTHKAFVFSTYADKPLDSNVHLTDTMSKSGISVFGDDNFKSPGASAYLYVSMKLRLANKQRHFEPNIHKRVQDYVGSTYENIINNHPLNPNSFHPFNTVHQKVSKVVYGTLFYKNLQIGHTCSGCGLCVRECPDRNLKVSDNKVTILESNGCSKCLKCVTRCPSKAINFTGSSRKGDYSRNHVIKLYQEVNNTLTDRISF